MLGDQAKLRQVLINLLANAIKFTEKGTISLRVDSTIGDRFRFEVTDTGVGIPKEQQEQIFESFMQSDTGMKQGGTGLGLSISKRQIELMGGTVELESEPGRGSRFFFTITLSRLADEFIPTDSPKPRVLRVLPGTQVKALIVDDVPENRDVLTKLLEDLGITTDTAHDGNQSIEKALSTPFDIIFMDIQMPGMDGEEARKQIANQPGSKTPPIVAISASVLRHQQKSYVDSGFSAFIGKPFIVEELCDCLGSLLDAGFEYAEPESATGPTESPSTESRPTDWSGITLSQDLMSRFKQAAKANEITALTACIDELAQRGPDEQQLAGTLRSYLDDFEIEAIADLLEQLEQLDRSKID